MQLPCWTYQVYDNIWGSHKSRDRVPILLSYRFVARSHPVKMKNDTGCKVQPLCIYQSWASKHVGDVVLELQKIKLLNKIECIINGPSLLSSTRSFFAFLRSRWELCALPLNKEGEPINRSVSESYYERSITLSFWNSGDSMSISRSSLSCSGAFWEVI